MRQKKPLKQTLIIDNHLFLEEKKLILSRVIKLQLPIMNYQL